MIEPSSLHLGRPVVSSSAPDTLRLDDQATAPSQPASRRGSTLAAGTDPVLCGHCGRTASNGISCQGMCVADSGY